MFRLQRQQQQEDVLVKTISDYLVCHTTYMIRLVRAHNFVLRDLGPINFATRFYISILASARHRCTFLVNILRKEYLDNGGDPEWLKGIEYAPDKIRALNKINKILAHQPWLFKMSHIEDLVKGPNPWPLSELTHAIIIMAHFHALCSLAFGCKFGLAEPEAFDDEDADYEEVEIEELRFDPNGSQKIKKVVKRSPASKLIIERCRQLELEDANLANIMSSIDINGKKRRNFNRVRNNSRKSDSVSMVEMSNGHSVSTTASGSVDQSRPLSETSSTQSNSSPNLSTTNTKGSNGSTETAEFVENTVSEDEWRKNNYDVFIDDPEFRYLDFARKGRPADVTTFRIQDYQWDDQGYALSNYLYPDIGNILDEKFKVGYNMTYYTLGPKTNIDTSPFRRAIWNYIQSIYGVRHDDYNYREVNILLERNLKCFIKCLSCYPELVMKRDFSSVMKGFRASEKIHVIVMVSEARLQAEILYGLRTLMEYIKLET